MNSHNDYFEVVADCVLGPSKYAISSYDLNKKIRAATEELKIKLPEPEHGAVDLQSRVVARGDQLVLQLGYVPAEQPLLIEADDHRPILDLLKEERASTPDRVTARGEEIFKHLSGKGEGVLSKNDKKFMMRFGGGIVDIPLVDQPINLVLPDYTSPQKLDLRCYVGRVHNVAHGAISVNRVFEIFGDGSPIPLKQRGQLRLKVMDCSREVAAAARIAAVSALNGGQGLCFWAFPFVREGDVVYFVFEQNPA